MSARKKPSARARVARPTTRTLPTRAPAGRLGKPTGKRGRSNATPAGTAEILGRLERTYPDARCSLDYLNPFQLLVATILSAQSTDVRVNMVTPALFARYPDPPALAETDNAELEELIRSTGFFRNKAKSLIGMARALVERHGGEVPRSMEELTKLPGVGRKTANVVLGNAFGLEEGIVVDTHVTRVSGRLGLTRHTDPVKIEQDLIGLVARDKWTLSSHLFIYHGRAICDARRPRCEICPLNDLCPSSRV